MENTEDASLFAKLLNLGLLIIILISILSTILATFEDLAPKLQAFLSGLDHTITTIFIVEYGLRVWTADLLVPNHPSKGRKKYILSGFGILDFLIIVPGILPFVHKLDLRVLRIFRVFRLLRIFKMTKYLEALIVMFDILKQRKAFLISTFTSILALLLISSMLMYIFENEAQPDVFSNALSGLWWAVVTVTTVGYGDMYPVTIMGRILGTIIAFLGIALVAVPTGIISSGLTEYFRDRHDDVAYCENCGHKIDNH